MDIQTFVGFEIFRSVDHEYGGPEVRYEMSSFDRNIQMFHGEIKQLFLAPVIRIYEDLQYKLRKISTTSLYTHFLTL